MTELKAGDFLVEKYSRDFLIVTKVTPHTATVGMVKHTRVATFSDYHVPTTTILGNERTHRISNLAKGAIVWDGNPIKKG